MTMCTCGHSAAEHPDGDACIVEGDANWGMWADDCAAFTPAAPSPVDTTEPPAEALRDDDHEPYANAYEWEPVAARPSADTETLRERIEALADDLDETVLALGRLGDLHHVVERLRAALDAR
jgi:hypothetical protein